MRLLTASFAPILIPFVAAAAFAGNSVLQNPHDAFWSTTAPDVFRVKFATSKGEFVIEAHRDWALRGADRFYNLVRAGFFDDSRFFRVRAGLIAQFGIAGDPRIAQLWRSETIPDDGVRETNVRGTVAYAMTGPNARTTQLFINLADNTKLDAQGFAPVGKVISGMQVIDQLYSGYGEDSGGGMRGGKQDRIFIEGNTGLDRDFPRLEKIVRAIIAR